MEREVEVLLLRLLREHELLALAVLVEGKPYASQLPFAATARLDALLVHATSLARHSRGLVAGAPWSGVVAESEGVEASPFERARVTLEGTVSTLERGSAEFEEAKRLFLAKLPDGELMFGLGDFHLHALKIERGRLFAGFARTVNLSQQMLSELGGK